MFTSANLTINKPAPPDDPDPNSPERSVYEAAEENFSKGADMLVSSRDPSSGACNECSKVCTVLIRYYDDLGTRAKNSHGPIIVTGR